MIGPAAPQLLRTKSEASNVGISSTLANTLYCFGWDDVGLVVVLQQSGPAFGQNRWAKQSRKVTKAEIKRKSAAAPMTTILKILECGRCELSIGSLTSRLPKGRILSSLFQMLDQMPEPEVALRTPQASEAPDWSGGEKRFGGQRVDSSGAKTPSADCLSLWLYIIFDAGHIGRERSVTAPRAASCCLLKRVPSEMMISRLFHSSTRGSERC